MPRRAVLRGAACRWIRTAPERAVGVNVALLEVVRGRYWSRTKERCKINQLRAATCRRGQFRFRPESRDGLAVAVGVSRAKVRARMSEGTPGNVGPRVGVGVTTSRRSGGADIDFGSRRVEGLAMKKTPAATSTSRRGCGKVTPTGVGLSDFALRTKSR